MSLALSLWLNCFDFLLNQASRSKNGFEHQLIRYDANFDADTPNQLGSVYTKCQCQRCDDASDTGVIENNVDAPDWSYNSFSSDSIVSNEHSSTSVIAELSQRWHWCSV